MESKAVNVPGPAIKGKTMGTSVLFPPGESFRNISTPKIISMDMIKITSEPATANEETSTLNSRRIISPKNKNKTMITKEYTDACNGLIRLLSLLRDRNKGTEPSMSIRANKTTKELTI
jgi:hypothetical protein